MPRKVTGPEGGYKRLPALRPEDLNGADVTVATISEVQDNIPVTKPDGRKKWSMRLRFDEFPGNNYWPNATSQTFLKKRLGPDTRTWVGRKIVLEVVETENPNGEPVLSLWVAEPPTWSNHIKEFASQVPAPPAPSSQADGAY